MPDEQTPDDVPTGYWAAFGYQNHVLPAQTPKREDGKLVGLCGVMSPRERAVDPDDRPVCSWCWDEVRTGRVRIVPEE